MNAARVFDVRQSTLHVRVPQPTSRMSKLRRLQGANVMRFRNVFVLLTLLLGSLSTAPSVVFAQTETGRITGVVTDQSGLVVPGATITLTSTTAGGVRTTTSDAGGRYVIANVQPGSYSLKVELSGFAPQTSNVQVNVGAAVSVENKLQVAGTAEVGSGRSGSPVGNIYKAAFAPTI